MTEIMDALNCIYSEFQGNGPHFFLDSLFGRLIPLRLALETGVLYTEYRVFNVAFKSTHELWTIPNAARICGFIFLARPQEDRQSHHSPSVGGF